MPDLTEGVTDAEDDVCIAVEKYGTYEPDQPIQMVPGAPDLFDDVDFDHQDFDSESEFSDDNESTQSEYCDDNDEYMDAVVDAWTST